MKYYQRIKSLPTGTCLPIGRGRLAQKLKELELKIETHDEQITAILDAINQLLAPPQTPKKKMGCSRSDGYAGGKEEKSFI